MQSFWDDAAWRILYLPGHSIQKVFGLIRGFLRRLLVPFKARNADYVFIHRELTPIGPPIIEGILVLMGKRIIYDFDDAIWIPATSTENKIIRWFRFTSKVQFLCKNSFNISVGNAYLAQYALQFNPRVVVNPTTIDTQHLHNPALVKLPSWRNPAKKVIGWTGTHSTLPYLEPLIPVFSRLLANHADLEIVIIANKPPDWTLPGLRFIPWNLETEMDDLAAIDMGVMPLTDDPWAKGKCGFKALQYMALGIPALATPIGVNSEIIEHGVNGWLCTSDEDWESAIGKLLANSQLRKEMGNRARKFIELNYSVVSNSERFSSLFP